MKAKIVVLAVVLVAGVALAQAPRNGQSGQANDITSLPDDVGTVIYDTGAPADLFPDGGGDLESGANHFDTQLGNPLIGGTVYAISFYLGPNAVTFMSFTIWPNPPVSSAFFGVSVTPGAFNAFSFAPVAVDTNFFAGAGSMVGFVNASTQGQGFHGGQLNWGTFDTFDPVTGANAMVRITGDIIVPVELMHFQVE